MSPDHVENQGVLVREDIGENQVVLVLPDREEIPGVRDCREFAVIKAPRENLDVPDRKAPGVNVDAWGRRDHRGRLV